MSSTSSAGFITTKSSQLKQKAHDFKLVVHSNYKKQPKQPRKNEKSTNEKESDVVDMKRARFEVYKFSKSDLNFSNRQESNVELAIKLGARPTKNKGKNYKILKAERVTMAKEEEEKRLLKQLTSNFKNKMANKKGSNSSNTFKRKTKGQGILDIYGKVKPKLKAKMNR